MTEISGNNVTYEIDQIFDANGLIIDRTGITNDSVDYFPSGANVSFPFNGKINISFNIDIYNSSSIYTITVRPGTGGTMRPGIPNGAQEDIIQPNSLKKYTIIVRSSTTYDVFNLGHNGQTLVTEKVITNNIEQKPGTTEVTLFQNVTNIVLGSGGTSANDDGSMTIYGNLFQFSSVAEIISDDNITYSVGQILGGLIIRKSKYNVHDILPSAVDIISAIPKVTIGTSFVTHFQNSGIKTVFINESTGITISGTDRSISKERTKIFLFVVTNKEPGTEAMTAYILGSLLDADNLVASLVKEVRSQSYTVLESDNTINVNTYYTWGAKCYITLPKISTIGQKRYFIADSGGYANYYNIIVTPAESDTILGKMSFTINSKYGSISMYNDEVNNWILY